MTSSKPFEKLAFESQIHPEVSWTYTEVPLNATTVGMAKGYDAVCVFVSDELSKGCIQSLAEQGVKLIALRSAGFNHVDIQSAKELGLQVVRVPKYSPNAVAEFAVTIYLCLNRKVHRAHNRVRENNFSLEGLMGHDVHLQTIGLIGAGAIGKCVAQIFRGFGARVLISDPVQDVQWAKKWETHYVSMDILLEQSDVVSLHLPLNKNTRYLINSKNIKKMKPQAFLVNTSRGGLVETDALIEALKKKQLAGAALDVYEEEEHLFFVDHSSEIVDDVRFSVLNTLPNVLITSHQAFLTQEAVEQIAKTTIQNVLDWSHGLSTNNFL